VPARMKANGTFSDVSIERVQSTGPSPGFCSRRANNHKEGSHFLNIILDVCSNRGTKDEMGVHGI